MKKFRTYLIEEDGRVDPATYNLAALYDGLNAKLFNRELPDIPVEFGRTPKGAQGVTRYQVTRKAGAPKTSRITLPNSLSMVISERPFRMDMFYGIVAHEMIHVWCAYTNHHQADSHGMWFQSKRAQIETKAGFKIPAKDVETDEEETKQDVEKPVSFIAGKDRSGKEIIALFRAGALDYSNKQAIADQHCKDLVEKRQYQWAMYGRAVTTLTSYVPLHRDIKEKGYQIDWYVLPHNKLSKLQVIGSHGKRP